jgi:hypothetical protein
MTRVSSSDGLHPDLRTAGTEHTVASSRTRVHHVMAADVSADTAQSVGIQRIAALSGRSVGSEKIWMGDRYVSPEAVSDDHHHGDSETAIFVRSGNPEFVFHDGQARSASARRPVAMSSSLRSSRTAKRSPTRAIRRGRTKPRA